MFILYRDFSLIEDKCVNIALIVWRHVIGERVFQNTLSFSSALCALFFSFQI